MSWKLPLGGELIASGIDFIKRITIAYAFEYKVCIFLNFRSLVRERNPYGCRSTYRYLTRKGELSVLMCPLDSDFAVCTVVCIVHALQSLWDNGAYIERAETCIDGTQASQVTVEPADTATKHRVIT